MTTSIRPLRPLALALCAALAALPACASRSDVDHAAGRVIANDNRNAITLSGQVQSAAAADPAALAQRHARLIADARGVQSSIDDLDAANLAQQTHWVQWPLGLAAAARHAASGDIDKAVAAAQETILSSVGQQVRDSSARLDDTLNRALDEAAADSARRDSQITSIEGRLDGIGGLSPDQIAALIAVLLGGSLGGGAISRLGRSRAETRIDDLETRIASTETALGRDGVGSTPYIDDLYEQLDAMKSALGGQASRLAP